MGVGEVISFLFNVFVLWIQSVIAVFFPPAKKSIDGQIVLITGAGHGIGRQLALEIVRVAPQAHLVLWDLNKVGSTSRPTMTPCGLVNAPKTFLSNQLVSVHQFSGMSGEVIEEAY